MTSNRVGFEARFEVQLRAFGTEEQLRLTEVGER